MSATSIQVESLAAPPRQQQSILPNAWHLSFSQIVRRAFRMVLLFWTARLLGVGTFGEYALMLTLVEMMAVVSGSGYISYLTREIAADPEAAWPLSSKVTLVRLGLIVPAIGIAFMLLWILRFPMEVALNTSALAVSLFPRAIGESAQGVLGGLSRFAPLSWIEAIQGCILVTIAPLLIIKGCGLRGVLAAEVLAAIGGAVCASAAVLRFLDFQRTRQYRLRMILHSLYAFNIFPFITNVYDRADVILLSRLAGNFATGIYSLPYRVLGSLQIVPYGLMGALLPRLSASGGATQQTRTDFTRALQLLYSVALLMVLTAIAFASPMVQWVLGSSYAGSALAMKILIWAAVPMFVNHALNILLLAARHERVFLWTTTICTVFNLAANLLFIPRYSFAAAAVITVLTELVLLGMNFCLVRKLLGGIAIPSQFAAITLAFVGSLLIFRMFATWTNAIWPGVLVCTTFGGICMWMARDLFASLFNRVERIP
jgi:O-antigen/teichoic acid export membrane protein